MATPVRLDRRPKARPAAPEAAPDRFETFMTALEDALQRRMDATPPDSPQCAALFDVYMSVRMAAKAARAHVNQTREQT